MTRKRLKEEFDLPDVSDHRTPHLLRWRALEVQGVRRRTRRLAYAAPCNRLQEGATARPCDQLLIDAPELPPRYNIAPGTGIAAVRQRPDSPRELAMLRWGLIPSWAKDKKTGYRMINARAESVTKKPAFRNAYRYRRCLIPASGFYEWQKRGKKKQPWFITLKDTDVFAFAGLWERWKNPKDETEIIESCTIITTDSNSLVKPLHDRMPVIMERGNYDRWLSRKTPGAELGALLRPLPPEEMTAWPVTPRVNSPANDSPECVKRL